MISAAVLSDCGRYRYLLEREWEQPLDAAAESAVLFVMLNPSTADAHVDDPTIRRCIGFARAWGHTRLIVANLFALRATDPAELRHAAEPVGADNDRWIRTALDQAACTVAAWGAQGGLHGRADAVLRVLAASRPVYCLGVTADGSPAHPLYIAKATQPTRYR